MTNSEMLDVTPLTNEERLEVENKQLRDSIEIYAQQCMELSRFARKYEQLENQMTELISLHSRVSYIEDSLEKLGLFLSKRAFEGKAR